MSVTVDEVRKIANLARLDLSETEIERLAGDLSRILEFSRSISEIDTSAIPPTSHVLPIVDVLRDDERRPSIERSEALASAPRADDACFVAPKIV